MLKQNGFQVAEVIDEGMVATLHGTAVVQYYKATGVLIFNTGGWHTRATAKAMNQGLAKAGLSERLQVSLFKGQIVVKNGPEITSIGHRFYDYKLE